MNNKITVLIPTHERHNILLRAIKYYDKTGIFVLIIDSSLARFNRGLPENIKYMHVPDMPFGDKIYAAISKISTPYTCLCADDDFLSESGLDSGLRFLHKHLDYSSVQGNYIQFSDINLSKRYHPIYDKNIGQSIDFNSVEERVKKSLLIPQIFALHRTGILKKCLKVTVGLKAISAVEVCISFIATYFGKHAILPIFWSARDMNRYSSYVSINGDLYAINKEEIQISNNNIVITDWNGYIHSDEGIKFKKNLFTVMAGSNIDTNLYTSEVLFDLAFNDFLKKNRIQLEAMDKSNSRLIAKIKIKIKKILPIFVISIYRFFIQIFKFKESEVLRDKYKNTDGYPWSNNLAMKDWINMKKVIVEYKRFLEL